MPSTNSNVKFLIYLGGALAYVIVAVLLISWLMGAEAKNVPYWLRYAIAVLASPPFIYLCAVGYQHVANKER